MFPQGKVVMKITFAKTAPARTDAIVLFVGEAAKLAKAASALDKASGGHIGRAIAAAGFEGKKDTSLDIVAPARIGVGRVMVLGIGDAAKLTALDGELAGGAMAGALQAAKVKTAAVHAEIAGASALAPARLAALLASGARLRDYRFTKYKTRKKDEATPIAALSLVTADATGARKAWKGLEAVATGVHLARDLVNEPANHLFPDEFARRARELTRLGIGVEVIDPRQMARLGMGALLGVAQGSSHPARLVVMRWAGGRKNARPVAFVGKGVTFDTGGISMKPAAGMEDMKGDMGGAACVTGLMAALAGRKAKVNAVGVIGVVENMPDGNAQRPGDVVTSMSGQTIAVLNTDAEGRLVLADCLWYTQSRFKPQVMVNLATLTGAILVALGKEHAGLFSNNDELAARLTEAGLATGEKVWRMPLAPEYDKLIDSDIADMKNIGTGRNAGAITAAQFLQRFVNEVPWAHLDVAGTAMDSVKSGVNQSWGSGWGVRLLDRLVAEHYEK
jgi:leucyl aminopeptidase